MDYDHPGLQRALAGEYVLGTLDGAARQRFASLLAGDPQLMQEVALWESQLLPCGTPAYQPVSPRAALWALLQAQITAPEPTTAITAGPFVAFSPPPPAAPAARPPQDANGPRWRWVVAATVAALLFGAAFFFQMIRSHRASAAVLVRPYVAQLRIPDATLQFTLSLSPERGIAIVEAMGAAPALGAQVLTLWWISPKGPQRIGPLPAQGRQSLALPPGIPQQGPLVLAISPEPDGAPVTGPPIGPPTGPPTGPVVTSGEAWRSL